MREPETAKTYASHSFENENKGTCDFCRRSPTTSIWDKDDTDDKEDAIGEKQVFDMRRMNSGGRMNSGQNKERELALTLTLTLTLTPTGLGLYYITDN